MSQSEECLQHCTKHSFQLIPTDPKIKDKDSAFASFCSYSQKNNINDWLYHSHFADLPIFNIDNNYASAAFILQSERQTYNKNLQITLQKQWNIITQQYCQKSVDYPAYPRRKNNYCSACRVNYEDYFKHIQRYKHKFQVKKSPYNKHIRDLISLTNKKGIKSSLVQGQQQLQTIDSTICSLENDSDLLEVIQKPRKRLKGAENRQIIVQQKIVPMPFRYVQLEVDAANEFVRIFRGQQRLNLIQKDSKNNIITKNPPLSTNTSQIQDLRSSKDLKISRKGLQKEMNTQYIIIDD